MKILYNFCSRSRPTKLINCLDNIIFLSKHTDYIIVLTLDIDDTTVSSKVFYEKIKSYGKKVVPLYGYSENKVHAINRSVNYFDFDIICNHSDDMKYIKEGFDLDILEAFENYSGMVHFPDQKALQALCTYSMLSKDYYDKFGYIYNPEYESVYCDHESQDVAKRLNKYKFIDKKILEHHHPIWGYGQKDELLEKTEHPIVYAKDKETYQRRLNNNFYL